MGLEDALGKHFAIDWDRETYDGILACSIKRYDAEFHSQSSIEGILQLRDEHQIRAEEVQGIHVDIFKAGYDMIGGGKYLDPKTVSTKEDADHSLNYLLAVALIDGEVLPEQFTPARIQSPDVQSLLQKVVTWLSLAYTRDYPQSLKSKVRVGLKDGRIFEIEKDGYDGFFRHPMPVEALLRKFRRLAQPVVSDQNIDRVIESVAKVEERPITDLLAALREIHVGSQSKDTVLSEHATA
jgi:2-methylcitrate dehydratase